MLLKNIETLLRQDLNRENSIQSDILKIVLGLILKIDESHIDNTRSELYKRNDNYELRLYSNDKEHCNLFISFLQGNIVDIQLNKGGEYLYLQSHRSKDDLDKLDSALRDVLFYPITETLTFCGDKIIKAVYNVNHNFDGKISQNEYSMSFGSCLPWKIKRIEKNEYDPWINKEQLLGYFR